MLAITVVLLLERRLQLWCSYPPSSRPLRLVQNPLHFPEMIFNITMLLSSLIWYLRWVHCSAFRFLKTIWVFSFQTFFRFGPKVRATKRLMSYHLTMSDTDKVQIALRNARQILNVVTATFPSFESNVASLACFEGSPSAEELACKWRDIVQGLEGLKLGEQTTDSWLLSVSKVRPPFPNSYYMTNESSG